MRRLNVLVLTVAALMAVVLTSARSERESVVLAFPRPLVGV